MTNSPFQPLLDPPDETDATPMLFTVKGDKVHIAEGDAAGADLYLGRLGEVDCWAVDLDGDAEPDVFLTPLLGLASSVSEAEWQVAGRAVQLVAFRQTHKFCGRCGAETAEVPGERAMRCGTCGLLSFPRLAPATITLVTRDDGAALLARNANFPIPMYSCIAGFVEPGETLEQTVAREVKEEVGIDVGKIKYFASQPWPFPHSLMIGFQCEWTGGDIEVDGVEIAEANWYLPDDLPPIPPRFSIARTLIDHWLANG